LLARRASLVQRHERVAHDLQRRLDPLVGDSADRAIQLQNDEALQAIDDATVDELGVIDEALERLGRGLYGICKECGGDIELVRLRALHAVTCADCAAR
jgi:RNA polymerase-binding transcription factor DksA